MTSVIGIPRFKVLHLSDSHIGNPKWSLDMSTVMKPLFDDIRSHCASTGHGPDMIVFNGDLAYGELPDAPISAQYAEAHSFFQRVHDAIGIRLGDVPVILAPGNHDIDRTEIGNEQTQFLHKLHGDQAPGTIEAHMRDGDATWRGFLRRQQEWARYARPWLPNGFTFHDSLNVVTGFIDHHGIRIGITSFNTSWGCAGDEDKDHLWIGRHQYQMGYQAIQEADLRIAITHHPLSWLNSAEEGLMTQWIESDYHIHMHGHDHTQWIRDSEGHLLLGAGACYQGSTKRNAYSWLDIDFEQHFAKLTLRTFSEGGTRGWGPFFIPGKTLEDGTATVKNFLNKQPASSTAQVLETAEARTPNQPDNAVAPLVSTGFHGKGISPFVNQLEDRLGFRWEPNTFAETSSAIVIYWPVRLRKPTPIHAVQTFAAAGLQGQGAEIHLWLDDLGSIEYPDQQFESKIRGWFGKAGGDSNKLHLAKFTELLEDGKAQRSWSSIQSWFGTNPNFIDSVLRITKLWPDEADPERLADNLKRSRPRRLLSPAMVWTGLLVQHDRAPGAPVITLGGYDERQLWQAWRECATIPGAKVGHLYIPQLGERPVHMASTNLAWSSKQDIRQAIEAEIAIVGAQSSFDKPNSLIKWCIDGCILLPNMVRQATEDIVTMNKLTDTELVTFIVDTLAKWLL